MQRIWRQMFSAVAALLAFAGISSAQSPPPNYLPSIPIAPSVGVVPATGGVVRVQGTTVVAPAPTPVAAAPAAAVPFGQYGPGCNNGCGSCKSDAAFMFGSCKSFFDPCGPKAGKGHGGLFHNRANCAPHPFATPYGMGYNGCVYDSYLNH